MILPLGEPFLKTLVNMIEKAFVNSLVEAEVGAQFDKKKGRCNLNNEARPTLCCRHVPEWVELVK